MFCYVSIELKNVHRHQATEPSILLPFLPCFDFRFLCGRFDMVQLIATLFIEENRLSNRIAVDTNETEVCLFYWKSFEIWQADKNYLKNGIESGRKKRVR